MNQPENKIIENCTICARIPGFLEIEDSVFPPEFTPLQRPNEWLKNTYTNEYLLMCPWCGMYYLYRKWTPGGSEDAMRTYVYESITRLNLLDVWMKLEDDLFEVKQRAEKDPRWWAESFLLYQKGMAIEMQKIIQHPHIIASNAIAKIKEERSKKVHPYYRAQVQKIEERAAEILAKNLLQVPNLTQKKCIELISILNNENAYIRRIIFTVLQSRFAEWSQKSTLKAKIKKLIQKFNSDLVKIVFI